MFKTGIIYNIDLNEKVFSLYTGRKLIYYYLSNTLMKKFKKYLYKGNLVSFNYTDEYTLKGKYYSFKVNYFKEIIVPRKYGNDILYSKKNNSYNLDNFLNKLDYLLFIDLEMSMPGYKDNNSFISELIQVGYLLVDKNDEILLKKSFYIKPTVNNFLTKRTTNFLNITFDTLKNNGIEYIEFYNQFENILDKYNPGVIVFGKNDKLYLESSYINNNVKSLTNKTRFINLNQLLKNYYELNNDPGLFNMYKKLYNEEINNQKHDALEDALFTYYVYKAFKKEVSKNINHHNI